jgi:hypothetical protein
LPLDSKSSSTAAVFVEDFFTALRVLRVLMRVLLKMPFLPKWFELMVARNGTRTPAHEARAGDPVEPPTPAFSGLRAFIRGATPLANASRWTALVSLTPHLLADFEAVWSEATGIRVKFELNRVACYNS